MKRTITVKPAQPAITVIVTADEVRRVFIAISANGWSVFNLRELEADPDFELNSLIGDTCPDTETLVSDLMNVEQK